jgi:O-antigen/teichoic acid export membrane protein
MLKRISQSFSAQLLRLLVSFADRFIVVGVLVRVWGPDAFADWSVVLSCASLLALGEMGLNIYYGNVWQKAHVAGDEAGFQRMVSVALGTSLLLGTILAAIGFVLLAMLDLPSLVGVRTLAPAAAVLMLQILAVAAVSRIVRGAISPIYRGHQAYARGVVVDVAFMAALIVGMVTAALLGAGPVMMAAVYLAVDLIAGWGLMLRDLSRRWPELSFRPALPTRSEFGALTGQVRWLAVQQGVPVAWLQVPVVLLGAFAAAGTSLVSFLILRTLVNMARQFASMLSISSGIEIANTHYAGRSADVGRQLSTLGYMLSAVSAGIAVAVALFGRSFVTHWTGLPELFDPAIAIALFGSALIATPSTPLSSFAILANLPRPAAIASIVQLAVGVAACAALAAGYGATGAAIGLAAGEIIGLGVVLPMLAARQAGLDYLPYFARCVLVMTGVAIWTGLIGLALLAVFDTAGVLGFMAAGVLWGVLGLAPAMYASLPAAHRARFQNAAVNRWRAMRRAAATHTPIQ